MKTHTQTYKENLVKLGKEIEAKVIYTINGVQTELDGDTLGSVTPHYEGAILKSVMKQVDIVSDIDIPLNTEINVQFGLKFEDENYEYVDYGNYIVFSSEKQEDTNNYKIIAYDKMLYAMKDYEELEITYPITIRNYLIALCTKLGLEFANSNDTFTNYDKQIKLDLYKDLGYTYRDILDELAQVTASTICINKDDELEIRYINDLDNELQEVEGTNLTISDAQDTKLKGVQVEGNTTQNGTPTPTNPVPINNVSGLQEVEVCGKNLFDEIFRQGSESSTSPTSYCFSNNDLVLSSGTYTLVNTLPSGFDYAIFGTTNPFPNSQTKTYNSGWKTGTTTFTISQDLHIGILVRKGGNNFTPSDISSYTFMIYKGTYDSSLPYEPYKGNTYEINLGKNLLAQEPTPIDATTKYSPLFNNNTIICNLVSGQTYTLSFDTKNTGILCYFQAVTGVSLTYKQFTCDGTRKYVTFTTTSDLTTINSAIASRGQDTSSTGTGLCTNVQVEKGNQATSYSPYFTPIELNKISTYKDYIFKGKGVNLFDKDNANILQLNLASSTTTSGSSVSNRTLYIPIQENTTYTIQKISSTYFTIGTTTTTPTFNMSYTRLVAGGNATKETITTGSGAKYLIIWYYNSGSDTSITEQQILNSIIIEEGSVAHDYEPYNAKDKWLLHKEIGKVVLNGSESWSYISVAQGILYRNNTIITNAKNNRYYAPLCNYFRGIPLDQQPNRQDGDIYINVENNVIDVIDNTHTTTTIFKNFLASNNVNVYYVLATPTTTEITNSEVIDGLNKLEKAKLYQGVTNISSTFPIKFSYASDYETIDEDYIKNTRADFGEKYGPVNSIVLSRSADTDNVYIQDEDSIEENGLCEIKIKDNQILNDNDRSDFLPGLLEQLGGIEYYTNNFESIGITYLDLCDRYKVKIEDNIYDCVMFNNEVEIGDGLNEIIYTDKPEITQTDYKKASKTDKQERQTYLIVDKQNEKIEALVGDIDGEFASINFNVNGISSRVQTLENDYSGIEGQITGIRQSITTQTATAITDWFNLNLKTRLDNVESTSTTNNEEIIKIQAYIRRGVITDPESPYYNQAYVEIGDDTNETTLRILKNRIQFLTNGVETAFISNNQLYINESTILTKEKVGHWVTTEDDNGLLNTYWEE